MQSQCWLPDKWDREADVVVVGYGGAGKISAITAHDSGAKILIVEKASDHHSGGNTLTNAGGLFVTRDPDSAFKYLKVLNWGATPDDVIRAFVDGCGELEEYLQSMGFEVKYVRVAPEFPEVGNWESIMWGTSGCGLIFDKVFREHVNNREILVLFETPATELIQNHVTKEIIGIVAEHKGKKMYIKAKKAVILCTGGFAQNEKMKLNFLPAPLENTGSPYNTGDGIHMAMAVGADLWHMPFFSSLSHLFKIPGEEYLARVSIPGPGFIWVDKYGKRFTSEWKLSRHGFEKREDFLFFDHMKVEYPRIPAWVVTDESTRLKGSFCEKYNQKVRRNRTWGVVRGYQWSDDNIAEISKGWILKGNTIGDLAKKMEIDPKNLEITLEKYNEYNEQGKDPEFGRDPGHMGPVNKPPYYAIKIWPGIANTQGGPVRNAKAQICDRNGNPIKRLYSAGELGSICGFVYQSSENMAEVYVFGQIAGKNAAKEMNWDDGEIPIKQ